MERQDLLVRPKVIENCVDIDSKLDESIVGVFSEYAIRFFYKPIEDLIDKKDRKKYFVNSLDFDVVDIIDHNLLVLPDYQELDNYHLSTGIFIVYSDNYFDMVSREDINNYLEAYGYDFRYDSSMDNMKRIPIIKKKNQVKK